MSEVDDILNFPAMLVSGKAGSKFKSLIGDRLDFDRASVKALRFANMEIVDDPLQNLPTIHFQKCSGLETTLPVIVDSLFSNYIDKICPRNVFNKALSEYRKDLLQTESSMLSKALCTIYTVLTRCRGPLIWIETFPAEDHPLIKRLKVAMEDYKVKLSFMSDKDVSKVTDQFITHVFNSGIGDIEDMNYAWEESMRLFISNVRNDVWACVKEYGAYLRTALSENETGKFIPHETLPSIARLKENSGILCNALDSCCIPAASDLSAAIHSLDLLFKMHLGNWVCYTISSPSALCVICHRRSAGTMNWSIYYVLRGCSLA